MSSLKNQKINDLPFEVSQDKNSYYLESSSSELGCFFLYLGLNCLRKKQKIPELISLLDLDPLTFKTILDSNFVEKLKQQPIVEVSAPVEQTVKEEKVKVPQKTVNFEPQANLDFGSILI